MKRYGFRLACLLVLVFAVLWLAWQGMQNRLTIVNQSGQRIASVKVTIGGETQHFSDISDGREVVSPLEIKQDDQLALSGRLADGTIFKGKFSFAQNSTFGARAKFTIQRNGVIAFEQK